MPTPDEWSRAFARQATADFDAYAVLCRDETVAESQRLHFLQMACEKLAKAYLCAAGSDPDDVQSSHAYTAKVLPIVVRQEVGLLNPVDARKLRWLVQAAGPLAREIELLSPAVDCGGTRLANCEYPWEDAAGNVQVPAEYAFPNLSMLRQRAGILLLIRTG